MKYVSTNQSARPVSFKDAVINGMPEDGGLYMPENIPALSSEFMNQIGSLSYSEIGTEIAGLFIEEEIPHETLSKLVEETLSFPIPLVSINKNISTLELFHGPTMAFKDVGARFMARCLGYFSTTADRETTVLVATSGDTGSAVAHGFYGVEGIKVVILYPSGKISEFQELQMTRLGKNITALEVDGTFDDCQRLVKAAFKEDDILKNISLTSANSINIARLVPQIFYYFIGFAQIPGENVVISVPSGNYGNLTAGLLANRIGLPIKRFVASSNRNEIVPAYLRTGEFQPKSSITTISNAMDVGNPSNFDRMLYLFGNSVDDMRKVIQGYSYDDNETRKVIKRIYDEYGYILDPHGAVGYLGLEEYLEKENSETTGIFLETAHPSKFREVVEPVINKSVQLPEGFKVDSGPKLSIPLSNDMDQLKEVLLD